MLGFVGLGFYDGLHLAGVMSDVPLVRQVPSVAVYLKAGMIRAKEQDLC